MEKIQTLVELQNQLAQALNFDDLRVLCFELKLDFDELRGTTKSGKIASLLHLRLTNEIGRSNLLTWLSTHRSNVDWQDLLPEDLDFAKTSRTFQDIAIQDEKAVRIFNIVVPVSAKSLLAIGLAILVGIAIYLFYGLANPTKMLGTKKLALASFVPKSNISEDKIAELSRDTLVQLAQVLQTENVDMTVWGPDRVRKVNGTDLITLDESAREIAQKIDADILVEVRP